MKRTPFSLLAAAVLALAPSALAAPPSAPFTPDADTLLLLHFDNNLTDASSNAYNGSMSAIAGYTSPAFVSGQVGYGQCLEGNGVSTLNGVTLPTALGTIANTPLTVEAWVYLPTPTANYNFNVLDLAAGRFQLFIGVANGNPNVYPQLHNFNGSVDQADVTDFSPSDGWTFDAWHHVAVTYNPSATPRTKFFLDGVGKVAGAPAINSDWQRVAFPGLTAGKVWPDPPTSNVMPLNGKIDEVRLSKSLRYGAGDTLLHLKFDGNVNDSSSYSWPTAMTTIGGYADPIYVAAPAPYGQALEGTGIAMNAVQVTSTGFASGLTSPLTIDGRFYFPSSTVSSQVINEWVNISDRAFYATLRKEPNLNNVIVEVYTRDASLATQENYWVVSRAMGYTEDAWGDYRLTYDPASASKIDLYFNGQKAPKYNNGVHSPITNEFRKEARRSSFAGEASPPEAPTNNLLPLLGRVDDIKITSGILSVPDLSTTVAAAQATINVDGSAADWAALGSQAVSLNTNGRGGMTCTVKYAWDASYLYYLIQEGGADTTQTEAANGVAYESTGPWSFDTVAFFTAFVPTSQGEQVAQDFNPWFGFSSAARTDLYTARVNNAGALTQGPFLNATVRTAGTFAAHNRLIEARVKWSDLAATIDTARQPGGNLSAAITAGFKFGCQPLIVDTNWDGQSFIGGAQYQCPNGYDANSRTVQLLAPVSAVADWTIY